MKNCIKCKILKHELDFNKNKSKKDGLSSICKSCHSDYRKLKYIQNREKELSQVKEYQKQYEIKNNEKYNTRYRNNKSYSKKAGRTISSKCPKCEKEVFLTKKESLKNFQRYCSNTCRSTTKQTVYGKQITYIKRRSTKYGKDFDLDEDFLKWLLEEKQQNRCALSNVPIVLRNNTGSILYDSASLDRKDNKKGYTKDNVQWVVIGINYMKLDYDEEEAIKLLSLIKEHYTGFV